MKKTIFAVLFGVGALCVGIAVAQVPSFVKRIQPPAREYGTWQERFKAQAGDTIIESIPTGLKTDMERRIPVGQRAEVSLVITVELFDL